MVIRPKAVDDKGFQVLREQDGGETVFRVLGDRTTRWVRQTDFSNDEAVGYLADRLQRAGVEDALVAEGAVPGSTVLIGPVDNAVVFDWDPTMVGGAELLGGRGTDGRFDDKSRRTNTERREDFHARKDAQSAARQELAAERKAGHWIDPDAEQ